MDTACFASKRVREDLHRRGPHLRKPEITELFGPVSEQLREFTKGAAEERLRVRWDSACHSPDAGETSGLSIA